MTDPQSNDYHEFNSSPLSTGSNQPILAAASFPSSSSPPSLPSSYTLEGQVSAFISNLSPEELRQVKIAQLRVNLESLNKLAAGELKPVNNQLKQFFIHFASQRLATENSSTDNGANFNSPTYPSPSAPRAPQSQPIKRETRPNPTPQRIVASASTPDDDYHAENEYINENTENSAPPRPLSFASVNPQPSSSFSSTQPNVKTSSSARANTESNREPLKQSKSSAVKPDARNWSHDENEFANDGGFDESEIPRDRPTKRAKVSAYEEDNSNDFNSNSSDRVPGQVADLGGNKLVTIGMFNGKILAHIREYFYMGDNRCPTKKGIALSEQQWRQLKSVFSQVDAMFEAGPESVQQRLAADEGRSGQSNTGNGGNWRGGSSGGRGGRGGFTRANDGGYGDNGGDEEFDDSGGGGGNFRGGFRGRGNFSRGGGRGSWRGNSNYGSGGSRGRGRGWNRQ